MKLSTKIILPIILISALLILLAGCLLTPTDESPGYTPGTITGIIAAPCCPTSAEPVSEPCCVSPEYWCFWCQKTWSLQDGIGVVLTYGEDIVTATTTNEDGEFTFINVPPGKNYVITAYCPDYDDNRPLVKDVALEVASTFDTKITDLVSTSLGLVVDFLVVYTEWGPEDISLDAVIANKPNFWGFPMFKKLVLEVRRVLELENCGNVDTDEDVQDALCKAAEEISGLDIGCDPGQTNGGGEGEGECENPTAEAGGPYADEVCPGTDSTISFNGTALGTGPLTYAWNFGDGNSLPNGGSTPSHKYLNNPFTSPYTVTLTVTDDCGSTITTAIVTITESAGVTANAGSDQEFQEVCTGDVVAVDFTGSGTGTGTLSYAWDFGDNSGSSTLEDPIYTYLYPFSSPYTVTLTVTDECNNSDTDDVIVTVTITECINHAPVIDNLPPTSVQKVDIYQTYTYDVDATDVDVVDTLTYSLTVNPNGMVIHPSTGVITWTYANCDGETETKMSSVPTKGDRCHKLCDIDVTVKVTDNGCCGPLFDEKSFIVEVWQP